MEEYPYYILPYLEEYRQVDPNSERGKKLCRILALNIGDRAALRRVLGIDPPDIDYFCKDEPKTTSTFDTIDTFLEKFGKGKEKQNSENEIRSGLKEMVKNHQYQEAIDFIESQNLINPKKNIYFADQIRFLKKLIDLEQRKNK